MSGHVAWDRLVDYWAGDLAAAEAELVEEHVFGCAACAAGSGRIADIAMALRSAIPPIVSAAQVNELRARGLVVEENHFSSDERREVRFEPGVDILVHRLGGLALGSAERVQVTVLVESTGAVLFDDPFAPFERELGQVLVACQRHFASFPPDVLFEVRAVDASGIRPPVRFAIPHLFGG